MSRVLNTKFSRAAALSIALWCGRSSSDQDPNVTQVVSSLRLTVRSKTIHNNVEEKPESKTPSIYINKYNNVVRIPLTPDEDVDKRQIWAECYPNGQAYTITDRDTLNPLPGDSSKHNYEYRATDLNLFLESTSWSYASDLVTLATKLANGPRDEEERIASAISDLNIIKDLALDAKKKKKDSALAAASRHAQMQDGNADTVVEGLTNYVGGLTVLGAGTSTSRRFREQGPHYVV